MLLADQGIGLGPGVEVDRDGVANTLRAVGRGDAELRAAVAADPRARMDQGLRDLGVGFGERRDVAAQTCRVEGREQVADP